MNSNRSTDRQTQLRSLSISFRLRVAFLLLALVWGSVSGIAYAEDTVTSVELSSVSDTKLYVEDGSISLTLWANYRETSNKKDVTTEATWTSSSSAVKVDKGVLTASANATSATITGKYKGYSQTINVSAEYRYSELKLRIDNSTTDAPDKADVELGKTVSYDAFAVKTGSSEEIEVTTDAQWTTSNASVATVSRGVVTLVTAGTATITVKYQGRSDTIALTVTSPYKSLAITPTGPIDMNVGDTDIALVATAVPKLGTSEPVTEKATWKSDNISIAKVNEKGVLTAVAPGMTTVSVQYLGVSASVKVVIRTKFEALRITPDQPLYLPLQGGAVELIAKVMNNPDAQEDVTDKAVWESSDLRIATVGKDSTSGKMVVSPKGEGTTKIKATYLGLTKELAITVFPSVTAINIEKDKLDVYVDDTADLPVVKGTTISGDSRDVGKLVKWKSDNENIVKIENGKWIAKSIGTAKLTAEVQNSPQGSVMSDTIEINVQNKVLVLIPEVNDVSLVIGKETDLPKVHVVYEDGFEDDVTAKVTWKSSSPNLLVKQPRIKGLLPAKVTLTGTYLNKTVKVNVVVEEEFVSFVIEPAKLALTINKSQTIKVTGKTKSGKKVSLGSRLDWNSSSESLASIKGSSVKGLEEGTGKLTATIQEKTLEIPFTVKAKLIKLTVSETSFKGSIGAQFSTKVTAAYEDGKIPDVTAAATWTTSQASVAKVDKGVITAVGKGSATIKAVYEGKTITVRVSVK
ncbi:Ig-like domain-containing protein [Cohnella silvisoli]|uniref:BIG2 domain-containing protein n=1 Tax=Cohnella silvisoli TaxID=2873699 RepID=A0ABV1KW78_9BACL|nr:hypothetical protein [Cohnella silvisoli]MCD9023696.1 hypothetical protein [Cohnella silvisoli]